MERCLRGALAILLGAAVVAGCVGDIGGGEGKGTEPAPPDSGVPVMGLRRLSPAEYDRVLYDLLGDAAVDSAALWPQEAPSPFDNDYDGQLPSRTLVEAAETLARDVILRLMDDHARRDVLVGCTPSGTQDEACMRAFVERFGRRALRRPLGAEEVEELLALGSQAASDAASFHGGIEVIARALLQDIAFLYRVEIGSPVSGHPGVHRLDGFEIATRMSFLLWGSTPSDALLDLAASGELGDRDGVVAAARSMLADDKARAQVDRFHAMWLGYAALPHAPDIASAMRSETRALLDRVIFDEGRPWAELFTEKETFIDDALATHYGLPLPGSSQAIWVDVSDQGRAGLLSHGSFLSVANDVGQTSPVKRGLHVLRRLMCGDVPPPPPDVDTNLPVNAGECREDQLAAHAQGSCATCHAQFDPIGLGLEQYDVAGRFREHEDGLPQCVVDGDGELPGVGSFHGPAELGVRLTESGLIEACAVEHLFQYAVGRRVSDDDDALISHLAEGFADGQRFDELVITMVSDDAFFFRREPEEN